MEQFPGLPMPQGEDSDSWIGIGISVDGAVFGGVGELHDPVMPEQIEQVALELAQELGRVLLRERIIGSKHPEDGPSGAPEYGEA